MARVKEARVNGARARISRMRFAFTLTAPARVTVTLARWARHHRKASDRKAKKEA